MLEIVPCKSLEVRRVDQYTHSDVVVVEDLKIHVSMFREPGNRSSRHTVIERCEVQVPPAQCIRRCESLVTRRKLNVVLLCQLEEYFGCQSALQMHMVLAFRERCQERVEGVLTHDCFWIVL